jgi:hypothetical protein
VIRSFLLLTLVALLATALSAQDILKQLDLKSLTAKASETVEVNLDGNLLTLAARFLDDKNADEAKAKSILKDLKGIYVRSFTFDKGEGYTPADVEAVRQQASGTGWQKIVDVRKTGENVGVYLKSTGDKVDGVVVLAAEKREFTVVQLVGSIDPAQLRELSGKFGIPKLPVVPETKSSSRKDD